MQGLPFKTITRQKVFSSKSAVDLNGQVNNFIESLDALPITYQVNPQQMFYVPADFNFYQVIVYSQTIVNQ